MDNFYVAQLPFLVALIFLIIRIVISYKRGFVKEICGLVALIFAAVIVLLLSFGFRAHFDEYKLIAWASIVLVILMLVLYKLIDTILTTLKIMAKLPGINWVDKVLGPVFAICETIVIIWGVYCVTMVMDQGAFHDIIISSVRHNIIMKALYEYNYLYVFIAQFNSEFAQKFDEAIRLIDPSYH